jgi:hypothetical protein
VLAATIEFYSFKARSLLDAFYLASHGSVICLNIGSLRC